MDVRSMRRVLGLLGWSGLLVADPAIAAGAPAGLLNKTVTMSWSTSGTGIRADGKNVSYSNVNTRLVYISAAGRPFLRASVSGQKSTLQGEFGPGQGGGSRSVSIQGDKLVGTEAFASGARQFIATFDGSFASCSLQIVDAKQGGANIKRKGPDGAMYEITSVTTGSPTCSIRDGNAFAP